MIDMAAEIQKLLKAGHLKGWVSFNRLPDGDYFVSDSYPTLDKCKNAYGGSGVDGYINLALIPAAAIFFDKETQ